MKKSEKKFLNLPEYPGGKEALNKYIKENLRYPSEALEKKIEGIVKLTAEIDGNGNVLNALVDNGIGAGCDEEAVRLIKSAQFGGATNRGVRVKMKKKFKIEFKLPKQNKINYNVIPSEEKKKAETNSQSIKNYSYSIKINKI